MCSGLHTYYVAAGPATVLVHNAKKESNFQIDHVGQVDQDWVTKGAHLNMKDGMEVALREPGDGDARELAGLPELIVEPLSETDARALLASTVRTPLDPLARDRIVAEAHGNPMALLQAPHALERAELAGGFGLPGTRPVPSCIETAFHERFRSLPRDSQRLLLTAAADPTGDVCLLWRAAGLQEIPGDSAAPPETAGLIEFGTKVRFHHPLVRSSIYRRTSAPDRRAAHRALAEATDPRLDPDRRAWHRAHAAARPDESIAVDLEHSADRARNRGGAPAEASFLRRAAELTPDPARRATRALAAAQTEIDASGAAEHAHNMLAAAESGPLDDLQRARLERLRARLVFSQLRSGDAPRLLLDAADRLAPLDTALARDTLLEAINAAIFAGRLSEGPGLREVAEAARTVPRPAGTEFRHDESGRCRQELAVACAAIGTRAPDHGTVGRRRLA
ncbi:hypothetical protein [Streptomyces wuyuanensis]|uniref:hypothetical protein n=1 Tax=Streptomyces wuyuanensis TaxID=1196353 RepID=UPI00343C8551